MVFRRIAEDAAFATARNDPNKVTFQTLRHTFASRLVMRGVDLSGSRLLTEEAAQPSCRAGPSEICPR